MIALHASIRKPWSKRFTAIWSRNFSTLSEHKVIELELYLDSSILVVNFNWTIKQSHAGLDFELGLLGCCFHFNFYDIRHWNSSKHKWVNFSEL